MRAESCIGHVVVLLSLCLFLIKLISLNYYRSYYDCNYVCTYLRMRVRTSDAFIDLYFGAVFPLAKPCVSSRRTEIPCLVSLYMCVIVHATRPIRTAGLVFNPFVHRPWTSSTPLWYRYQLPQLKISNYCYSLIAFVYNMNHSV
jgi:hypothetical protein